VTSHLVSPAAARQLTEADLRELSDLVHRYAAEVDDRHLAEVAALFCADGVLVAPAGPGGSALAEHVGRQSVESALTAVSALTATFHAVVGVVLVASATDDEATGRIACIAHHVVRGAEHDYDEVWHLVYRDCYRRTPSGWRFARRAIELGFVESRRVRLTS